LKTNVFVAAAVAAIATDNCFWWCRYSTAVVARDTDVRVMYTVSKNVPMLASFSFNKHKLW